MLDPVNRSANKPLIHQSECSLQGTYYKYLPSALDFCSSEQEATMEHL